MARHQGRSVYAFTRPGDEEAQQFAKELGAAWAGGSDERPPEELDAAIIFAPVGALVPAALAAIRKGGTVVCGGIHMSDIPSFPYELLWGERSGLFSGESDTKGRRRIHGNRAESSGTHDDANIPARAGQRSAKRVAKRKIAGRGCS